MTGSSWMSELMKAFEAEGLKPQLLRSKTHLVFEIPTKFGNRRISASKTSSDFRTMKNFKSQLRRLVETGSRK